MFLSIFITHICQSCN